MEGGHDERRKWRRQDGPHTIIYPNNVNKYNWRCARHIFLRLPSSTLSPRAAPEK